jgi:hypothetical protein
MNFRNLSSGKRIVKRPKKDPPIIKVFLEK